MGSHDKKKELQKKERKRRTADLVSIMHQNIKCGKNLDIQL